MTLDEKPVRKGKSLFALLGESDDMYEYEEGDVYIVSTDPITQDAIDDAKKGATERIKENPDIFSDYYGETPLEEYLSGNGPSDKHAAGKESQA